MTDRDELESAVLSVLELVPSNTASVNVIRRVLLHRDHEVERAYLIRVLDSMVAAGELEVVGEKRDQRRYGVVGD